jgi:hypothetical protein
MLQSPLSAPVLIGKLRLISLKQPWSSAPKVTSSPAGFGRLVVLARIDGPTLIRTRVFGVRSMSQIRHRHVVIATDVLARLSMAGAVYGG